MEIVIGNKSNKIDHVVLWSGGVDSTLIVDTLLSEGVDVTAIYINLTCIGKIKQKIERERISLLMDIFKSRYKNNRITLIEITTDVKAPDFVGFTGKWYAQPILWLINAYPYIRDNSILYLGYLADDCMPNHLDDFRKVLKDIDKFMNRKLKLLLPLITFNKSQVLIESIKSGLFQHTWTCENPNDNETICYSCVPCKTLISAMGVISVTGHTAFPHTEYARKWFEQIYKERPIDLLIPSYTDKNESI